MPFPIVTITTNNTLEEWLDKLNEVIGALDVDSNGVITGTLPYASDGEAQAKAATGRVLRPSNLAALGSSETFAGLVELATNAESITGTDNTRGVHPQGLKAVLDARTASETQTGLLETATNAEAQAKSAADKILVPSNLAALAASETFVGLVELATNAETVTGTDTARAVHAAGLKAALDARTATTTQTGLLETATDGEAQAKAATNKILVPSNLAALGTSETFAGLVELATTTEAVTGTDTARAVTAAGVKAVLDSRTASTSATGLIRLATSSETRTATATDRGLTASNIKDYASPQTLTDAATVSFSLASGVNAFLTLTDAVGAGRTLGTPTGSYAGASGVIRIQQSVTGSKTLSYSSVWKFSGGSVPVLTTTASAYDVLFYYVDSVDGSGNATRITAKLINDIK